MAHVNKAYFVSRFICNSRIPCLLSNRSQHLLSSSTQRHYSELGSENLKLKNVNRIQQTVDPYGSFSLRNARLNLVIKPACPDSYPHMDTAICSLYSNSGQDLLNVTSSDSQKLTVDTTATEGYYLLELPIKFEIDTNSEGNSSVDIQSMESGLIKIQSSAGDINAKGVKGDLVDLKAISGSIKCGKSMQGKVYIETGSGDIIGSKFQGPLLVMKTLTGNIETESVYSDVSNISTNKGNIHLKNLHRECHVEIKEGGNLTISGMDGTLEAKLKGGNHDVQISRLDGDSHIQVEGLGSLNLKVPDPCPFNLRIRAGSISLPPSLEASGQSHADGQSRLFEIHGGSHRTMEILCESGAVVVEHEDWFSSLGLSFK